MATQFARLSATAQSLYSVAIGLVSSAALLPAGNLYGEWGARIYLLMSIMAALAGLFTVFLRAGWSGGRLTEKTALTGAG